MSRNQSISSNARKSLSRAIIEPLQSRQLMSVSPVLLHTDFVLGHREASPITVSGGLSSNAISPSGYTPAQIRAAYGVNQIKVGSAAGNGAGQTIAIVDAYNDPKITVDLATFDRTFDLSAPPSFKVENQTGGTALPRTDPNAGSDGWGLEESLDVEWAHSIAPGASIVLLEANSPSDTDLFAAVNTARHLSGVSVVSMSFGGSESAADKQLDSIFTTPAGHNGVTFVASSGDAGAYEGVNKAVGNEYPASSPNVLAVGGTSLYASASGAYEGEAAWSGSGGGISSVYAEPSYQKSVDTITSGKRGVPDVSFLANPNTGVSIIDSFDLGASSPWETIGGTSLAAPCWAGLIAITNQGRVSLKKTTLDGPTQTLPAIYGLPSSDFNDITSGNNGYYSARSGYDDVTGRGTPKAVQVVDGLAGLTATTPTPTPTPTPTATKGSISGGVYWDLDNGGTYRTYEGLAGWTVFVDVNHDGRLDSGDVYTYTNASGQYDFSNVPLGTYNVDVYLGNAAVWYPVSSPVRTVTVSSAHPTVSGVNFAVDDWANFYAANAATANVATTDSSQPLFDSLFSDREVSGVV
ncbi:MAG TPA: S53 family peptidase [Tepidisphaeraceae bacterium]|jgi:subtilase family serine protease|nr:S53 family peptidase [Tepidisphaeraceae bacterium]